MSSRDRAIYVKQGGQWNTVVLPAVNHGGTWSNVTAGYSNVNGTWMQFYPNAGQVSWTVPGTYTFKVPPGVHSLTVDASGGGGGGGGGEEVGNGSAGGGGGSGGYVQAQSLSVVPGETLIITVGGGGSGAPFVGRTSGAPGGGTGGTTSIQGSLGSIAVTGGAGGSGGASADRGGGGGGSIICTKLYELGYLSDRVYEADEKFGEYLRATDPDSYYGYLKWASTVVAWIEGRGPNIMPWIKDKATRTQRQQELVTRWTVRIATPWAHHMAYLMGAEEQDNRAGKIIMNTGKFISRLVGRFSKTTEPSKNPATGYVLWATFGVFWLLAGIK